MSKIVRSVEPDVYFHEDAGYVVPPKKSNLAPILLIARCGTLGLRANGMLVRLHRPDEWPGGMFGEWTEISMKGRGLNLDQVVDLVEETESMLLLPEKSLDMENLALVCLVWAQSHHVNSMTLKNAMERVEQMQNQLDNMQDLICTLHERTNETQNRNDSK
jgi:hypothetical protein